MHDVNRRSLLAAGFATGAALLSGSGNGAVAPNPARSESRKAWAQTRLRGGESFVMPSLHADLRTLDEEGVRRDVRHAISQGFCSILPLPLGIDSQTDQAFQRIVADEARGRILTVGVIRPGTLDQATDTVRLMESNGVSHALMYFDPALPSEDEMYRHMRTIIENTTLGIILYASPKAAVTRFDPTGLPLNTFNRLADIDNVVGIKFTQELRPASALAVAESLGDRLLLGVVDLEVMLLLSLRYRLQWTGQWAIDSLQSPQTPWVGEFLDLLRRGRSHDASKLYWRYESIASGFYALQAPSLRIGGHPWVHIKYMKWLTGGNGGLLPDLQATPASVPHLDAAGRAHCRQLFASVGIRTTDLPDEAFVVGNAAYERGTRLADFRSLPQYQV